MFEGMEYKYVYSIGTVFGTVMGEQQKKVNQWAEEGFLAFGELIVTFANKQFFLVQVMWREDDD